MCACVCARETDSQIDRDRLTETNRQRHTNRKEDIETGDRDRERTALPPPIEHYYESTRQSRRDTPTKQAFHLLYSIKRVHASAWGTMFINHLNASIRYRIKLGVEY